MLPVSVFQSMTLPEDQAHTVQTCMGDEPPHAGTDTDQPNWCSVTLTLTWGLVTLTWGSVTRTWGSVTLTLTWGSVTLTLTWGSVTLTLTWGSVTLTWGSVTLTWGSVTLTWGSVTLTWGSVTTLYLTVLFGGSSYRKNFNRLETYCFINNN